MTLDCRYDIVYKRPIKFSDIIIFLKKKCLFLLLLWMNWVIPNSYIEALTPDVTVFSNGASREVIKIKWGSGGSKMVAE